MTPTERNLRAQLDAANIQIRSLERDIRELRAAIDIKTDEIERVRVILGPTAGLRAEDNIPRAVLDGRTPREMCVVPTRTDATFEHPGAEQMFNQLQAARSKKQDKED